ncbi:MAG: hypothetical protein ACK5LY_06515 [Lachnospirales bacterium]
MAVLIIISVFFVVFFISLFFYQAAIDSKELFEIANMREEYNPYTDQTVFTANSINVTRIKPSIVLNNKAKEYFIKLTFTIYLPQKISHITIDLGNDKRVFYNDKEFSELEYNEFTNIFTKDKTSFTMFLREEDVSFFRKIKNTKKEPIIKFHAMAITSQKLFDEDLMLMKNIMDKSDELIKNGCTYDNKTYLFKY